ncbi:MAG: shikimate dehydrogenase [Caulobacteraceae bacterium]
MMKNVYGLIGEKLGHSFSPQIHSEIFKKLGIEGEYKLFELKEDELKPAVLGYKGQGIKGLNVTVPYKIRIMDCLDIISTEAEKIGAVNTISLVNGVLTGYNTDYSGFGMSLARSRVEVNGKSAVILGTGGVSKAVAQYLMDNGAKSITYVSRNPVGGAKGYDELEGLKGDMIINCTPCGMYPKVDVSPVSYDILEGFNTAIDMIYNPEETMFLKQARENGLKTVNGLYMLVGQAVAAQEIWNGIRLSELQLDNIYQSIKKLFYKEADGISPITIRTYNTEDVGHIIKRHRELYDSEYGFGAEFGDYVEKYMLEFDKSHDSDKENIWVAEADGKVAGAIAIVRVDNTTAQLRWFLIEPDMRGRGLGHKLVKTVIDFCKDKGYKHVFLWTVNVLEAARHLYKSYGFNLTEVKENNTWGDHLQEERWDLYL